VIAALAIGSSAFGISSSLKKAIKKEVAKQLAGKTGPAGPAGAPGAPGAPGSALGFATILGSGDVLEATSSSNVTDANVTVVSNVFCFNGLPFTPKVVVGNIDNNFAVGHTVQTGARTRRDSARGPSRRARWR
jgi:hypothetical protein